MANKNDVVIDVIINGAKSTATLKEMQQSSKQLWKELNSLTPGTQAFIDKAKELKQVDTRIKEIKDSVKGMGTVMKESTSSFSGMWSEFAKGAVVVDILNQVKDAFIQFGKESIEEAIQSEKAQRMLQNTLKNYGKEKYFDRITREADMAAKTFSYLDNDDIIAAQEKLVLYGKLTVPQITEVTKVAIDLAARLGVSVPEATDLLMKALDGNGKELKKYGISIKDAETFSERLGVVTNELGSKVKGSAEDFANSSEGIRASTIQMRKNMEEELGNKLLPIYDEALKGTNTFMDNMMDIFNGKFKRGIQGFMQPVMSEIERAIERQNDILAQQTLNDANKLDGLIGNLVKHGAPKVIVDYYTAMRDELKNQMKDGAIDKNSNGPSKADMKAIADAAKKREDEAERLRQEAVRKADALTKQIVDIEVKKNESLSKLDEDEFAREIKLANDKLNADKIRIDTELKDMQKNGASEIQLKKAKDDLIETAENEHLATIRAINTKHDEKLLAEEKKAADDQRKANKDAYDLTVQDLQSSIGAAEVLEKQAAVDRLSGIQTTEAERIQLKDELDNIALAKEITYLEALIAIQKRFGESSVENEKKLVDAKARLYDKDAENKRQAEEYKHKIGQAALDFFRVVVEGEIEMLGRTEQERKQNAVKIKNLQRAQIVIDGIKEVASVWENVQKVQNSGGNVYYAQALGAILTASAVARTGFALSKVDSTGFYSGGFTGNGSGIYDGSGNVAGVVHANEWVAPQWMVSHPQYGPMINWMEDSRTKGFANGGFTTTPTSFTTGIATNNSSDDLRMLREDMRMYTSEVSKWKRTVRAHMSVTEAATELKQYDELRSTFSS